MNLIQKHPGCKKGAAKNLKKARMKKNLNQIGSQGRYRVGADENDHNSGCKSC